MSTFDALHILDSGDITATADGASPSALVLKLRFRLNKVTRTVTMTMDPSTVTNVTQSGARFWFFPAGSIPSAYRGGARAGVGTVSHGIVTLKLGANERLACHLMTDQVNGAITFEPIGTATIATPAELVDIPAGFIGQAVTFPWALTVLWQQIY